MTAHSAKSAWDALDFVAATRVARPESAYDSRGLPHLMALPATLVQMELLLNDPVVDLHALAEVVSKDLAFTIQLLRLSNMDRHPENYFLRIEDCLVDLGIDWLLTLVREAPLSLQRT